MYSQWKAGGDATTTGDGTEYVTFQQTVSSGLAALAAAHPSATLELESMVWMQGESDTNSLTYANAYQVNLATFIADVRATFGANLPFIIGRLSDGQTANDATGMDIIQAAQDAVAASDPLTEIVNTNGFALKSDQLHFDANGQQSLGSSFAEESAYYSWMIETFQTSDIASGLAEPGADRDGDGQTNRQEFLAASNPLSSSSFFKSGFKHNGNTSGQISYDSSSARMYEVQRFAETNQTWVIALPPRRGTGTTVTRPLVLSGPRNFYRVRSSLP